MCVLLVACGDDGGKADAVCKHFIGLAEKYGIDVDPQKSTKSCKAELGRRKKKLGKQRYAAYENCLFAAKDVTAYIACERAAETPEQKSNRALSAEADHHLKRLYASARAYYVEHKQLPDASAGPTPPKGVCCKGAGSQCQPDVRWWNDPVWHALGYTIDEPHYYSYEFTPRGDRGNRTGFFIEAFGDLDCDRQYSTFTGFGRISSRHADGMRETVRIRGRNELE